MSVETYYKSADPVTLNQVRAALRRVSTKVIFIQAGLDKKSTLVSRAYLTRKNLSSLAQFLHFRPVSMAIRAKHNRDLQDLQDLIRTCEANQTYLSAYLSIAFVRAGSSVNNATIGRLAMHFGNPEKKICYYPGEEILRHGDLQPDVISRALELSFDSQMDIAGDDSPFGSKGETRIETNDRDCLRQKNLCCRTTQATEKLLRKLAHLIREQEATASISWRISSESESEHDRQAAQQALELVINNSALFPGYQHRISLGLSLEHLEDLDNLRAYCKRRDYVVTPLGYYEPSDVTYVNVYVITESSGHWIWVENGRRPAYREDLEDTIGVKIENVSTGWSFWASSNRPQDVITRSSEQPVSKKAQVRRLSGRLSSEEIYEATGIGREKIKQLLTGNLCNFKYFGNLEDSSFSIDAEYIPDLIRAHNKLIMMEVNAMKKRALKEPEGLLTLDDIENSTHIQRDDLRDFLRRYQSRIPVLKTAGGLKFPPEAVEIFKTIKLESVRQRPVISFDYDE